MSNALNIEINQGADFTRVLTIKDSLDAPINLTGYSFRGQGRQKYDSTTIAFTFAFAIRTQTGGNIGKVDWTLGNTALVSLILTKPALYLYDVEMVAPSGQVTRILEGQATVKPEVTK